jgi:hypothetical protein
VEQDRFMRGWGTTLVADAWQWQNTQAAVLVYRMMLVLLVIAFYAFEVINVWILETNDPH